MWSFLFKCETIARLFGLGRFVKREKVFNWIMKNRGLFLAGTAATNLALHGTEHPAVVPQTLAMEGFNVFMCFVVLPLTRLGRKVKRFV